MYLFLRPRAGAKERLRRAREYVESLVASGETVYGVTTGFGKFGDVRIPKERVALLQRTLILSHATGVGEPLAEEAVRAMMLLRANTLAKGLSGVRPEVVETLLVMLNRGVHPVIPEKGSVGASGDLAPLAHMVMVLLGEGEAWFDGRRMPGGEAMRKAGLHPLVLQGKEGLALINGTQAMTAIGVLAWSDADIALRTADVAAAMSFEALRGLPASLDARIHEARPHPGQVESARHLRSLLAGSELLRSEPTGRVQDAYSLRCVPQVHGAARDALAYVRRVLETEVNSATDNPLVFPADGCVVCGGNFHGQPVAVALDFLCLGLAGVGTMAERRIDRLLNPQASGLPAFLSSEPGFHSGLMMPQYVAAALASENKLLVSPACVDSIPTSGGQEDHVSMGMISARKSRALVWNLQQIVGIELLCAAQALELLGLRQVGAGVAAAHRAIRRAIPPLDGDRFLHPDVVAAAELVRRGAVLEVAEAAVGAGPGQEFPGAGGNKN